MDAELKQKWLTALRSGEYKKGTGRLRKGDGYCCLGVLCEVVGLPINKDGTFIIGHSHYEPLRELIGPDSGQMWEMADLNDAFPNDNFAGVIPLIEKL